MNPGITPTLIRELVQEVVSELVAENAQAAKKKQTSPPPAKNGPLREAVTISCNDDLLRFVSHLLNLTRDPRTRRDIESGKRIFELNTIPGRKGTKGAQHPEPALKTELIPKGLINETRITELAKKGVGQIGLGKSAVLTPLGRDKARELGILIERVKK